MYLGEKYVLDFGTIARFRRENRGMFKELFLFFVTVLKRLGMLHHMALFTDSTKIKANACDERYLTKDELRLYKELMEDAMKKHEINDDAEEERLNREIERRAIICRKSVRKMKRPVGEVVKDVNAGETERVGEKLERAEKAIAIMVEQKNVDGINMTDHMQDS